jgi:hypothetical protein
LILLQVLLLLSYKRIKKKLLIEFNENSYSCGLVPRKDIVHLMLLLRRRQMLMLLMMIRNNFNRLYEIEKVCLLMPTFLVKNRCNNCCRITLYWRRSVVLSFHRYTVGLFIALFPVYSMSLLYFALTVVREMMLY